MRTMRFLHPYSYFLTHSLLFVLTYSYIHSRSFSHSAPLSIAVLPSFSLAFDGYLSILLYLCKLKRRKNNDSLYSRET